MPIIYLATFSQLIPLSRSLFQLIFGRWFLAIGGSFSLTESTCQLSTFLTHTGNFLLFLAPHPLQLSFQIPHLLLQSLQLVSSIATGVQNQSPFVYDHARVILLVMMQEIEYPGLSCDFIVPLPWLSKFWRFAKKDFHSSFTRNPSMSYLWYCIFWV